MARIRVILDGNDGRKMAGPKPRVYELGKELDYSHEIEGRVRKDSAVIGR